MNRYTVLCLASTSICLAFAGRSARAESAADAQDDLPDIVVTAQRRSESQEKTALTIQVVNADTLASAGVTDALDLTSVAPGVQVGSAGPNTSVYIRGVGSYASTAGQSPAVPFYTDGVYVGRSQGLASEFYDVDHIEILKGPQGTLYGRNASGGAINVLTRNPVFDEVSGDAAVEYGNYNDRTYEAALNLPVTSTLAVRLSGQIVDKGGYTSEGFGDDRHKAARIKLLWEPNDALKLLVNASYGHTGGMGAGYGLLNRNVTGWYPWLDINSPQAQAIVLASPSNGAFNPAIGAFGPGSVVPSTPNEGRQDLDFYNLSADFSWDFGGTTLTVVPAFRDSRMQYAVLGSYVDSVGYGFNGESARPETSDQTSLEARLTGGEGPLKYVAGLYYYNENQFQQYTIYGGALEDLGRNATYGTRSYAAFGQASFQVVDGIRLIGGLRETSDRRSISDGESYYLAPSILAPTSPCFAAIAIIGQSECLYDQYHGRKTFDNLSWKGGIEADVLNNGLAYATVSRGFKAGGFNEQSIPSDPGSNTHVGTASLFQPEILTSYEAGIKMRMLENRVQINAEGFFWNYANHQEPQLTLASNGAINLIYFNAGKARVAGLDVDVLAHAWRGGTFDASTEYAPSKYEDFKYDVPTAFFSPSQTGCATAPQGNGMTQVNCSGFQLARTPQWSGSAGFTQDWDLGVGKVSGNVNMTYTSARWLAVDFTSLERASPYTSVNLSLGYHAPNDRWSVTGFGRNLNDSRTYTFAFTNPLSPVYLANLGPPRTYGVRLAVSF